MQSVVMEDISRTADSRLKCITQAVAEKVGPQKFRIWFENSTSFSLSEGYLKIAVANPFIANWIESRFSKDIQQAVENVTGSAAKIVFTIDPQLIDKRRPACLTSDGPDKAEKKEKINTSPDVSACPQAKKIPDRKTELTLETFVVGTSNELAYSAARSVVNDDKATFNPLFIHGGYGVGKTHLLQGICNAVRKTRPGTNWLYLSAEDFVNQFVLALKTKKLEAFRSRMRRTDLLAIDDIHFLASKPSTQEEFLHTFNSIDLAGKKVVLACDAHPKMIGQISEKLVNRFISGMVVKIENPDLQTRCEICRRFAFDKKTYVPESVIKYIAESLRSNVRELQGAMLKVIAYSALQNQKINLHTASRILGEHISRTDPMVHISDIESAVATFFGISTAELNSTKKDRTISLARHFSMYLARKHTNLSSPEIGRCMGNKNHATVLVGCKKVAEQIKNNTELHWQCLAGNKISRARTILAKLENSIAS
jgi:chromosomal replication initiator protein